MSPRLSLAEDLRSAVPGNVIAPSDVAFDETRQNFNSMIDHRPALIARCTGAAESEGNISPPRRRAPRGWPPAR
jgi:hypothetical protein